MINLHSNFSEIQHFILIGTLLGDGSLGTRKGYTWGYRCLHSKAQKDYLEHKYTHFKDFCKTPPRFELGRGPNNRIIERYHFNTRRLSCFKPYADLFYKQLEEEKKVRWVKIIPTNIASYLNPTVLAYWLMDDGDQKWKGHSKGIRISTQAFTVDECEILREALTQKFNLKVSLQKAEISITKRQQYRLYISTTSFSIIKELVYPKLLPYMLYKFPEMTF